MQRQIVLISLLSLLYSGVVEAAKGPAWFHLNPTNEVHTHLQVSAKGKSLEDTRDEVLQLLAQYPAKSCSARHYAPVHKWIHQGSAGVLGVCGVLLLFGAKKLSAQGIVGVIFSSAGAEEYIRSAAVDADDVEASYRGKSTRGKIEVNAYMSIHVTGLEVNEDAYQLTYMIRDELKRRDQATHIHLFKPAKIDTTARTDTTITVKALPKKAAAHPLDKKPAKSKKKKEQKEKKKQKEKDKDKKPKKVFGPSSD